MKCCLVTAPTTNDFTEVEFVFGIKRYPPLGILTLASILRTKLIEPLLVDLNDLYRDWLSTEASQPKESDFARFAAAKIASIQAEVFGFGTICSSFPLTLRIAQAVKAANPEACVILGGPQASLVAAATLRVFDGIDFIVRGEADYTFPALVRALQAREDFSAITGLTFRTRAGVVNTPDTPVIDDLDSLPLPAFDLYAGMGELTSIPLEAGRGCPFGCSFCATSRFFGRRFRMKTPELLVSQLLQLKELYKVQDFDLIHDNLVANKARLQEFCQALRSSGTSISWECSARTDGLDPSTIDLMAAAGCRGIFLGIESGSRRMQVAVGKNLDLKQAQSCIRHANKRKIQMTVALIFGFPQEKISDLRKTANLFVDCLRFDHAEPQVSLLSPLTGTPIYQEYQNKLFFTQLTSDLAFQGWDLDPYDRDLIAAHPELFSSYYALPTQVDRNYLFELRLFILWASWQSRWLLVVLKSLTGDILKGFDAWQDWVRSTGRPQPHKKIADYYRKHLFLRDFYKFMRMAIAPKYRHNKHIIDALVSHEASILFFKQREQTVSEEQVSNQITLGSMPVRYDNIKLRVVEADYDEILRCLRRGMPLSKVPRERIYLVTRFRDAQLEVVRIPPLAAEIFRLCNGKHTISAIATTFAKRHPTIDGMSGKKACLYKVNLLIEQRLIRTVPLPGSGSLETSKLGLPTFR